MYDHVIIASVVATEHEIIRVKMLEVKVIFSDIYQKWSDISIIQWQNFVWIS